MKQVGHKKTSYKANLGDGDTAAATNETRPSDVLVDGANEETRASQCQVRGAQLLQGPWQHFPYADDLAKIQVTPPGGIAFRPPPVRPNMMPHLRAPITKETIEDIRSFLIHINLGLSQSYNGKGQRDGFDVIKDQTDVTEDRIDVTRYEFDVPRDELDVTRDEFNVIRDEFDVTRDELDVTRDELDETRDELDVTRDKFDVTSDEFDVTRDEFDVTFFSVT
ncbi:hypothetical protein CRG98_042561 [Punica granatum]|uniref:Uncharacterized protein n=1 Tax=Punica granatum TaxID=22663 RepID=A0A2I0HZD3_PUNGR|nr:hypothetical protein CRG98_042561 [Punica granatum]